MKEYAYEYKCRRCGEVSYNPRTGNERVAYHGLLEAIIPNANFNEGVRIGMFSTHVCKDGGLGISDLQGFIVLEENKINP